MKNLAAAFVIGVLFAGGTTFAVLEKRSETAETYKEELLGYTRYNDYVTVGMQSLREQSKFLAATLQREETFTREIRQQYGIFRSDAAIAVTYTGEYSFGYDLAPNGYEIKATRAGLEIVLANKPMLVVSPAIKARSHQVPSKGWLINEDAATVEIYEGMDALAKKRGELMASEEAIVALCEKKMIAFLRDFLAKQPGVKMVPGITISYKS